MCVSVSESVCVVVEIIVNTFFQACMRASPLLLLLLDGHRVLHLERGLLLLLHPPRGNDNVQRDDAYVLVAELLQRSDGNVIRLAQLDVVLLLLDQPPERARVRLQVPKERTVVPGHVRLHARQERHLRLRRGGAERRRRGRDGCG